MSGIFDKFSFTKWLICALCLASLQACKHPLVIVGEGDIVDVNGSGHGCTLEQFQAKDAACERNEVRGDYFVNYKAEPRPGWRFVRWEGPCPPDSDFQHCRLHIAKAGVDWWDQTYPDTAIPASTAVFQPISGETGYLVAGTPVAGVTFETPTQIGVTGEDGSFQYGQGETVIFRIGDTVLGEVTGKETVTPFDLAGSAIVTGININRALEDEQDPFQTVINIAVLLHSLDPDADPQNGIRISQGEAALFIGVRLDVSQHWETFQSESTLRRVIAQANERHNFSTPHWLVKPAVAADQLYVSSGIDPDTVGITLLRFEDLNGVPARVERFQYDASGNIIHHDDGTNEAFESWQYDTNGNLTGYALEAEKYENIIDGGARFAARFYYNTNGNVIRTEIDANADGYPDDVQVVTWKYDRNRNPRYVARYNGTDGDPANPDFTGTWQYDTRGNLTQKREESNGVDCRTVQIRDYDTRGNRTRYRSGCGLDQDLADYKETWQYNANGNAIRHQGFWELYGLEGVETWQYDAGGNVVRYEIQLPPFIHSVTTWQYDARSNVTQISADGHNDITSWNYLETWQYDSSGNTIHRERRRADGTLDELETWRYDSTGNMIRRDLRDGNTLAQVETWRYWPGGAVTRTETHYIGAEGTTTYQYQATGWAHLFTHYESEAAKIRFAYPDSPWWLNYALPAGEPL